VNPNTSYLTSIEFVASRDSLERGHSKKESSVPSRTGTEEGKGTRCTKKARSLHVLLS
jgi:hypothetical protein